ncbi:hypothetical protein DAPPUDRAFT_114675 [Daphnia pulex]|uniref:Uncharacterized protein n=1 Tax=Daphnia pulex TaxID=6669 RepID=E9HIY0_DAPPU|nr:hypothetical protein DAPPUDRAFT_114675 [Daphnia pulex]|eukprot:EFX68310.1 hypothetical protein DAPPUDRAFT_114675 [Daphnia pulex]
MSTSCTSAALAATTSGSSGLARNTPGGTCAASLYASIDLHSDDADLRSGEEVSCEEDKTIEETKESPSQPSCSMMTPVLHHGMMMSAMTAAATAASSSSSSTSRRNKRKNFQPRNIRPNEEEQENNDTNNSRETTNKPVADADGSDDRDELAMPSDGPAACCSISESKITTISSGHRERRKSNKKSRDAYSRSGCDVADESNHVAATESRISRVTSDDDDDECSSRSSSSSRSSHSHNNGLISRNSSSSSSQASSHNRSNTAVDLRLRPAFHTEEEEEEDEEEEEEEDEVNNQMSDVSGLEMKTWMLFWQQQQSCNSNDGKPSFLLPPSVSHRQRPSDQQADSAASETHHAGRREVSSNYAETTMRELLGIYGLQRGAPAPAVDSLPSG